MIKILIGDIFESSMQTKVNTVNCVGAMGKGIAKLFKSHYPDMYDDYRERCKNDEVKEGEPYLYENLFGEKIINFPTKGHWKGSSNIDSIKNGLDIFLMNYKNWGIESVAFPPLGCGQGGLLWQQVGPLMYKKLSKLDIPVEIYAPFGTEQKYLNKEFLLSVPDEIIKNYRADREIAPGWVAIMEVIYRLENMKYANPVGTVIFQKLCYLAGLLGLQTNLSFKKGKFGHYSDDIDQMFVILGQESYLKKSVHRIGNMINTDFAYPRLKAKHENYLADHAMEIDRLTDLFSRIKSAQHAEEIGTIMYAVCDMTSEQEFVSEIDLYNYLINWKKNWDNDEKREHIAESIRYLVQMQWLKLSFSEDLPTSAML